MVLEIRTRGEGVVYKKADVRKKPGNWEIIGVFTSSVHSLPGARHPLCARFCHALCVRGVSQSQAKLGNRDPGFKIFFRRAVHVQSFQSPCTCIARPALPSDFIPLDRANQELNNAFLDESLKRNLRYDLLKC